jgi:hypothetical protein
MPIEIYIALLTACACIVILTALRITEVVYLKGKAEALARSATQLQGELGELIRESRAAVGELRQVTGRLAQPMEDVEHITRTARKWTERADRLIDAVGTVAEPPVFFLSKRVKTVNAVVKGFLQGLLSPRE